MLRGAAFLFALTLTIPGFTAGQAPAPDDQPKSPGANSPNDAKAKPADPSVFVLKGPEAPPSQPGMAPMLRAVDLEKRAKLDETTRRQLIQLLDAEFARLRKSLPQGDKSLVIDPQGRLIPNDAMLFQLTQTHGVVAKVGDKIQVTNVTFRDKSIFLAINGGPKKKGHWYDHVSIGVGGAGGDVTPIDPNARAQPTGAGLTLQFNKQIPQMTGDELKKLLSPVLDFSMKSAAEVYTETLPLKIQNAIKNHEVLVGMNRDMVVLAKDRPDQKVREKDEQGKEYEEWIYGKPPHDVVFVRLMDDEVTQVKTAKVGGQITVKTEKEVDVKDGTVSMAALKASNSPQDVKPQQPDQPEQPTRPPTLRREGEGPEQPALKPVPSGQSQDQHRQDEPEWGTNGKQPPPDPPKPPQ